MNLKTDARITWALLLIVVLASSTSLLAQNDPSGWNLSVLYTFSGLADGGYPLAGLVLDRSNNAFGTTSGGGSRGDGVAFKVDPNGRESLLYSFTGGADGGQPSSGLLRDDGGTLYGTSAIAGAYGGGTVYKLAPPPTPCARALCPWNEAVIYSFGLSGADGVFPNGNLIRDSGGNFYGVTQYGGGTNCDNGNGCGTVFKVDPQGNETVLYRFAGPPGDGSFPQGPLIQDSGGNLYGTTNAGGEGSCTNNNRVGCGTIFKIDAAGHESIVYNFTGGDDGANPSAGMVVDSEGLLYGTAGYGGLNNLGCPAGCGVVFEFEPLTGLETIHTFTGGPDGAFPFGGLLLDSQENLYGATWEGGSAPLGFCLYQGIDGCGVIFKIDSGRNETVLWNFTGGSDGANSSATLVMDAQGSQYGTAAYGGYLDAQCAPYGCGTVFKLIP